MKENIENKSTNKLITKLKRNFRLVKRNISFSIKADPLYFSFLIFVSIIDGLSFGFVTRSTLNFFSYLETNKTLSVDKNFILILSIFVFSITFNFFINGFINYLIEIDAKKITTFVNSKLHKNLNQSTMSLNFFNKTKNIELINSAKDGAFMTGYISMILIMFFTSTIPAIASMSYYLFKFDILLSFSFAIIIIPNFIVFKYQFLNYQEETEELSKAKHKKSYTKKMLSSKEFFKETRVLKATPFLLKKYFYAVENFEDLNIKIKKQNLSIERRVKLLNFLFYFLIFAYSVFLIFTKRISLADFGTVFTTTGTLIFLIENIFDNDFSVIRDTADEITALNSILDYKAKDKKEFELTECPEIQVKNMSFSYPDSEKETLKNINLKIPKGKTLAIVGENGSGKTTLSKLLLGLYEPTKGSVTINGSYTSEYKCVLGISAISQNFISYNTSIEEIIQIANTKLYYTSTSTNKSSNKIDELIEFSKMNKADNKFDKNTLLGKEFGGTELSKGQAQKLAIARALYPESFYICMDEATSALDPESEHFVISKMQEITKEKTSIIITHRLAMAKKADIILLLKDGEIAEQGSFDELIQSQGDFAKLFKEQAKYFV